MLGAHSESSSLSVCLEGRGDAGGELLALDALTVDALEACVGALAEDCGFARKAPWSKDGEV